MLKPYEDNDFDLLQSWITDADILFQFAGTDFTFPVTRSQIEHYRQQHPERTFYMVCTVEDFAFAFGEIIPQDNHTHRLGRLLVGDPKLRGKGFGRYLVRLLVDECIRKFGTKGVDLFVWEQNHSAIHCYEKSGFTFTSDPAFPLRHGEKEYLIRKMTFPIN